MLFMSIVYHRNRSLENLLSVSIVILLALSYGCASNKIILLLLSILNLRYVS